jgi:hypothetical protein
MSPLERTVVISINDVGDVLRDALDPRQTLERDKGKPR